MTVTSGESGGAALVTHDWWSDVDPTAATDAGRLGDMWEMQVILMIPSGSHVKLPEDRFITVDSGCHVMISMAANLMQGAPQFRSF